MDVSQVAGSFVNVRFVDLGYSEYLQSVEVISFRNKDSNGTPIAQFLPGAYDFKMTLQTKFTLDEPLLMGFNFYPGYPYTTVLSNSLVQNTVSGFWQYGFLTRLNFVTQMEGHLDLHFASKDMRGARFKINFQQLDNQLVSIDKQITELKTLLQTSNDTLSSIGLDVQSLLDLLSSDEFFGVLEDKMQEMIEEQQLSNEALEAIQEDLAALREYFENGGGSGGGGSGSDTGKEFTGVLDTILSGALSLIGELLGMLLKVVFGLLGWVTKFLGFINSEYLGGFFPAPIWAVVCVIIPLIVVLGLIRFVRGFL